MTTTKNIKDIIALQNYCKDMIQELYNHESRAYDMFTQTHQAVKIDEAIRLEIIEYDNFDDTLSLSLDTQAYYRTRLGQNHETNIGFIGEKLQKLHALLKTYEIRVSAAEDSAKDVKAIYTLLNQIPSILKHNFKALSSNSVFTFKNEPNFEIKMMNLDVCRVEIQALSSALKNVDRVIDEESNFFKHMDNIKINFAVRKIKRDSAQLEKSFAKLHGDIISFINQSIKDGAFIKHLKRLKQLKDENALSENSNIEALLKRKPLIGNRLRQKRILTEDKIYDWVDEIRDILKARQTKILSQREVSAIDYDISKETKTSKVLYDYVKIHSEFLAQKRDLISFLQSYNIKEEKLLGVFVRLLKNYSSEYELDDRGSQGFIEVNDRIFLKVFSNRLPLKPIKEEKMNAY